MNRTEILLNSRKNKNSTNEDSFIGVTLSSFEKGIPTTEDSFNVDSYQQYFKEKDASDKYRLAFTITPFCTNVLFNVITEPVYKEGSDDCIVALMNGPGGNSDNGKFSSYKSNYTIKRKNLIRDTGFSHPKITEEGGFVYHCGYDIFNNHYLRRKEYAVVASGDTNATEAVITGSTVGEKTFNTISDTVRNGSLETVENITLFEKSDGNLNTDTGVTHMYCQDNVYSYGEAVYENLVENNGWFGFLNAATLPIKNVKFGSESYAINKCLNDNKAWEQIDMYPDRSLYSFVPKINKYRNNRIEKNWDYLLTYPKEIDSGHTMVTENGVNGIQCKIVTNVDQSSYSENGVLTFQSAINHNLKRGDYVSISFFRADKSEIKTPAPIVVVGVGDGGKDANHYFSVRLGMVPEVFYAEIESGARIRKCDGDNEARYYLRKFFKIPGDIPASSLNKLAFSQNAYSDQVVQIVFTDDIDTSELTDYFNRPVTEIFLTIVKRNKGFNYWYNGNSGTFTISDIEFSHCFGEVTSGFDMPADDKFFHDYNVRRIHSIKNKHDGITESPKKLEENIYVGSVQRWDWFYGDIVEFFPNKLQETTIEDVYHRFNTAQRETENNNYSGFTYDEIVSDDFFFNSGFKIKENKITSNEARINLIPEGYYYKPHYRVRIKEFSPQVQMGQHTKLSVVSATATTNQLWDIELLSNYYFQKGDRIFYYKEDGSVINGLCEEVSSENRRIIKATFDDGVDITTDSILFRKNPTMPDGAYELNDKTGRYIWRDVMSFSDMTPENELYDDLFTNGAHYHHKNISFYLKRQDPDGVYGIGNEPRNTISFFGIDGRKGDASYSEYINEGEGDIC